MVRPPHALVVGEKGVWRIVGADGACVGAEWDDGHGMRMCDGSNEYASHIYSYPGTYKVKITVESRAVFVENITVTKDGQSGEGARTYFTRPTERELEHGYKMGDTVRIKWRTVFNHIKNPDDYRITLYAVNNETGRSYELKTLPARIFAYDWELPDVLHSALANCNSAMLWCPTSLKPSKYYIELVLYKYTERHGRCIDACPAYIPNDAVAVRVQTDQFIIKASDTGVNECEDYSADKCPKDKCTTVKYGGTNWMGLKCVPKKLNIKKVKVVI
jgi:hypothetical protein